ncbi:MAG: hypothetical protein RLZZ24_1638 [Pseudomonadota bacterium]
MSKPSKPSPDSLAALRALGYNQVPRSRALVRGLARNVSQVVDNAPTLSALSQRASDGQARLRAIAGLLPPGLRTMVQSGAVEDDAWCLLVPHAAAAAKLRQLLPALAAHLRTHGWAVTQLQVKVSKNTDTQRKTRSQSGF